MDFQHLIDKKKLQGFNFLMWDNDGTPPCSNSTVFLRNAKEIEAFKDRRDSDNYELYDMDFNKVTLVPAPKFNAQLN